MAANWLIYLYHGFIFLSPAYFANAAAVFMSGLGRMDGGYDFWDGKPLLGSHKTIGGFIGATIAGGLLGIAAPLFFPDIFYNGDLEGYNWYLGLVLGFGAILGDALGSFTKRRINLKPGRPFFPVDQIGFVITAFIVVWPFVNFPLGWLWTIPLTLFIHLSANSIAYLMGWKDVWW